MRQINRDHDDEDDSEVSLDTPPQRNQTTTIKKSTFKKKNLHSRNTAATAAAAKSFQSCPTLCDPIDGSPPGSSVPGIPRQEHWSGLPFPSPMHESEKWKWSCSVVSDSYQPHGLQPTSWKLYIYPRFLFNEWLLSDFSRPVTALSALQALS